MLLDDNRSLEEPQSTYLLTRLWGGETKMDIDASFSIALAAHLTLMSSTLSLFEANFDLTTGIVDKPDDSGLRAMYPFVIGLSTK
jgi:hypothetical protein